jgi:hypothetical protein
MTKDKKKNKGTHYGLAIPAGLFIGLGLGFLMGDLVGWMFIGLGVGFLVMLLGKSSRKNN